MDILPYWNKRKIKAKKLRYAESFSAQEHQMQTSVNP